MFCPNCNVELMDGTLVCTNCGAPAMRIYQERAVAAAKADVSNTVRNGLLSPIFIILASMMSIIALLDMTALFISFIGFPFATIGSMIFDMIPGIFAIIATVAAWKIVASRNKPIEPANVRSVAKYFGVVRGFQVVYLVFTAILGTIGFILSCIIASGAAIDDVFDDLKDSGIYTESPDLILGELGAALAFAALLIVALLMFMRINFVGAYGDAREHFERLADALDGDTSALQFKPPFVRIFIMSGVDIFIVLPMLVSESLNPINSIVLFMNAAMLITLGIMYILIHKKTVAALEALKRQQQILNDINTQMRPSSYQTPMYQQSYQQGYQQSYPQYPYQQ